MEILFSKMEFRANGMLRWVESMKILSQRKVMAGLQMSKQNIIFSVVDLFCITRSLLMLVDQCNTFVCWQIITNCFIYNLHRTRKRNRKHFSPSHHYAELGNALQKHFFAYSALIMGTLKGSTSLLVNFSAQSENFTRGLTRPNFP